MLFAGKSGSNVKKSYSKLQLANQVSMWKFPVKKQHRCSWGYKLAWDGFFFSLSTPNQLPSTSASSTLVSLSESRLPSQNLFPERISCTHSNVQYLRSPSVLVYKSCAWFCFPFIPEIIHLIYRVWFQNKVVKYRKLLHSNEAVFTDTKKSKRNQLWMSIKYNQCSPNLIPWSWLNLQLQKLYAITQHSFPALRINVTFSLNKLI